MESRRYLPLLKTLREHGVEFVLVGGLAAVLQGAPILELGDITVRVLELSRLIEAKEFANRPKDMAMLPALRATLEEIRKRK